MEHSIWERKQECPSWHGEWGGDFGISAKLHCFKTLILLLTAVLIVHTSLTLVNLNRLNAQFLIIVLPPKTDNYTHFKKCYVIMVHS